MSTDKEKGDSEDIWGLNIPYYPHSVNPGAQEIKDGGDCRTSHWGSQLLGTFCSLADRAGLGRPQASSLVGDSSLSNGSFSSSLFFSIKWGKQGC